MAWKDVARTALNRGARAGVSFIGRKLREPQTRQAIADLVGGKEPTQVLKEMRKPQASGGDSPAPEAPSGDAGRGASGTRSASNTRSEEYGGARPAPRSGPKQGFPHRPKTGYPGDYTGPIKPLYAPDLDGEPDPGEIVWGWVPYEEDHSQGKDRPVLVIGRDGHWLLCLMLTSKDNVDGGVGTVREDEHATYVNIGSGDWDSKGRPSEIRLDRVIRIEDAAVRREGAILPMDLFSTVVANVTTE